MPVQFVTPAVAASEYVQVLPSVLSAGGNALQLNGLILTPNPRVPVGTMLAFPNDNGTSVANYFGANAQETALAEIYFLGFNTSTAKPGQLLYMAYPWQQPAAAWLRGGGVSTLTLPQLQALNGALSVTINSVVKSATISLAGATSFSNAALLIQSGLGINGQPVSALAGSILGGTLTVGTLTNGPQTASFSGSINGTTLTVATMNSGYVNVGDMVTGTGVSAGTLIASLGSGQGAAGTYTVNNSQTVPSQTMTNYGANGSISVGSVISGTGVIAATYVTGFLTGTGGVGTYSISTLQTAGNQALIAYAPAVSYDSVFGAFTINGSTAGVISTITYASGALATSLALTQAKGATLSQGAVQADPATELDAIIAINQNWASFMTTFEPNDADKIAFAAWVNGKNNRYHYAMWDTNPANIAAGGPSSVVNTINVNEYSGTSMIHENPLVDTVGGELAAFVLGYGASLNFAQTQGRATAAFKSQTGLAPQVFKTAIRSYLVDYGLNCYVDATTANQQFNFYDNGQVSGPFLWLDSYLDQIWFNAQLQLALMELLTTVNSIPYNQAGYAMIANTCQGPIAEALNAGVIQPGVPLSVTQAISVNTATGSQLVAGILATRGWFLQIIPATPQVRAARGSPPINFWYTDGGSIQKITIASIELI